MFVLMSFHSSTDGASPPPSLCSGSGISISSVFTRIYWRGLSINWSETSTLKIYPLPATSVMTRDRICRSPRLGERPKVLNLASRKPSLSKFRTSKNTDATSSERFPGPSLWYCDRPVMTAEMEPTYWAPLILFTQSIHDCTTV